MTKPQSGKTSKKAQVPKPALSKGHPRPSLPLSGRQLGPLPSPSQEKVGKLKAAGVKELIPWEKLPSHLRDYLCLLHNCDTDGIIRSAPAPSPSKSILTSANQSRVRTQAGNSWLSPARDRSLVLTDRDAGLATGLSGPFGSAIDRMVGSVLGSRWSTVFTAATTAAGLLKQGTEAYSLFNTTVNSIEQATGYSRTQALEAAHNFFVKLVAQQEDLAPVDPNRTVGSTLKYATESSDGQQIRKIVKIATIPEASKILEASLKAEAPDYLPHAEELQNTGSKGLTRSTAVAAAETHDIHGFHRITHVGRTKHGICIVIEFRQAAFNMSGGTTGGAWVFTSIGTTNVAGLASPQGGARLLIGPDHCGNMWAKLASLYEEFHLERFKVEFTTQVGSLVSGAFVMGISKDPYSYNTFPGLNFGECAQFEINAKSAVWEPYKSVQYHCPDMGDYLFVTNQVDNRLSNAGCLFVTPTSVTPASAALEVVGNFFISGTCILTVPTPDLGITLSQEVLRRVGPSAPHALAVAIERNPIPFYKMVDLYGVVPKDDDKEDVEITRILKEYNLIPDPLPTPFERWRDAILKTVALPGRPPSESPPADVGGRVADPLSMGTPSLLRDSKVDQDFSGFVKLRFDKPK